MKQSSCPLKAFDCSAMVYNVLMTFLLEGPDQQFLFKTLWETDRLSFLFDCDDLVKICLIIKLNLIRSHFEVYCFSRSNCDIHFDGRFQRKARWCCRTSSNFKNFSNEITYFGLFLFVGDLFEHFSITGTVSFNLSGFIAHYEIGVNQ